METPENVSIDVHLEETGAPSTMAREVRQGLESRPKQLPSKYFYDERGSELFERITELPEYYLTRAERRLLERHADTIARRTGMQELVELGAGSAKKTRVLIEAALRRGSLLRYIPIEVSHEMAETVAHDLAERYPDLAVHAVVGDFDSHLGNVPDGGRRVVALLGSTIGNFPELEAVALLRKIRELIDEDDWLLLGTDLVKERSVLEAAYNDSAGVTAQFNGNILNVVNQHLGGDFDPRKFEHFAYYNEEEARIESYLRSLSDQQVRLREIGLEVDFDEGELLWTEVSCKYTRASTDKMLKQAGLELTHWLTDETQEFALSLSRLPGPDPSQDPDGRVVCGRD